MGTHGLLAFIINGRTVGFYNHCDSYPTGLGHEIVKFILYLSAQQKQQMAKQVEKLEWIDPQIKAPEELQRRYSASGFPQTHLGRTRISSGSLSDWYNLLYLLQNGRILPHILDGTLSHVPDNSNQHSEWDYYLDFEKSTMETYYDGNLIHSAAFEALNEEYAQWLEEKAFDSDDDMSSDDGSDSEASSDVDDGSDSDDEMEYVYSI